MEYVIIGAGPTGLGAAYRLQQLGITDYTVFERDVQPGGLAASFVDDMGYVWDFGVHVMHSHYRAVDNLLQELLPDGYITHQRRAWILSGSTYVPYPFQYNIHRLPPEARWECIRGLMHAGRETPASADAESFEHWMHSVFGSGIVEHFMGPYNRKMWRVALSEMSRSWVGDRVARPAFERVLRNVVLQNDDVEWGPNHNFLFPRHGGTGAIWNALSEKLPADRVRYGHDLQAVDTSRKRLMFANGHTEHYTHLISTIPLPELARLTGIDMLIETTSRLRHTRVNVLGVGLPAPMPKLLDAISWLYCADERTDFYRLTPLSPYSPSMTPDPVNTVSLMCECSAAGSSADVAPEILRASVLKGLQCLGITETDALPPHTYPMTAEYGYPVPTLDRDSLLNLIQPALEAMQVYSRGRFGGWKYEVSNMDHCLMQGIELADRLVNRKPECTLPYPERVNAPGAKR